MDQERSETNVSPIEENDTDSILLRLLHKWTDKNAAKRAAAERSAVDTDKETPLEVVSATEEAIPKGAATKTGPVPVAEEAEAAVTPPKPPEVVAVPATDEAQTEAAAQTDGEADTEKPAPVDAKVQVMVADDKLSVAVCLLPPKHGGADVTKEQVVETLHEAGIKSPIAMAMVGLFVNNKKYDNAFKVSKGTPAINGEDGTVKDLFPREKQYALGTREDGTVDYKDTNLVTDIPSGTVICEIIPPTDFTPGANVYGEALLGYPGRAAVVPKGKNTELSEDGLRLEATCSGNLHFANGAFQVDDVLIIRQNVDNAVGNIKFSGDVVIDGAVCEGYSVESNKNVKVNGTVEGASIRADGDIVLTMGINGMNKGTLTAKGNVQGRFFENCTIKAGISVFAESIMNCDVQADDSIIVKGSRGVIVGGEYSALNLIEAKVVGAPSNIATNIYLGATSEMIEELKRLKFAREVAISKSEEIKKDIAYLTGQTENDTISVQRKTLLLEKKKQIAIAAMKISTYGQRLAVLNEEIEKCKDCRLACSQIFPPSRIRIRSATLNIKSLEQSCFFYFADGEIKKGKN